VTGSQTPRVTKKFLLLPREALSRQNLGLISIKPMLKSAQLVLTKAVCSVSTGPVDQKKCWRNSFQDENLPVTWATV
jgi:hypothetical protein